MSVDPSSPVLQAILAELQALRLKNDTLEAKLDQITSSGSYRRGSTGLTPVTSPAQQALTSATGASGLGIAASPPLNPISLGTPIASITSPSAPVALVAPTNGKEHPELTNLYPQRVILATHPGQPGIKPLPLEWAAQDPKIRGPVVVSRYPESIKVRNAVGAHGGSYSVYRALSIALGELSPTHKPDFTDTEPSFPCPPNKHWFDPKAIVSMDPWGHMAPQLFKSELNAGIDIRPTIAMTNAHIKMPELDQAAALGRLPVDGKIVIKSDPLPGQPDDADPGVEINTSKAAVEPVWYLPGVAERLGISEGVLRRALWEETGGSYPELLTRPDLKVFLPPINSFTIYIFGPPEYLSDPTKELTFRPHDQCTGSDVMGSDICTCRPYLLFGIEEAVRCAQRGGVGLIIYFNKEGRALGEVTKFMVYNQRKRGIDSASNYFKRTENIAGVKDQRYQALMPDALRWLGVDKIDNLISMSSLKYDAIIASGIEVVRRYEIPDHLIPADSQVEIDAKIVEGGYYSEKKSGLTVEDLARTVGRSW